MKYMNINNTFHMPCIGGIAGIVGIDDILYVVGGNVVGYDCVIIILLYDIFVYNYILFIYYFLFDYDCD